MFNNATCHRNSPQSNVFFEFRRHYFIRFIDAFTEAISLESLGFATQTIKAEGVEFRYQSVF